MRFFAAEGATGPRSGVNVTVINGPGRELSNDTSTFAIGPGVREKREPQFLPDKARAGMAVSPLMDSSTTVNQDKL